MKRQTRLPAFTTRRAHSERKFGPPINGTLRLTHPATERKQNTLEESMGPVEARCPRRIIAAASSLRHPDPANERNYAAQWRQKCLDQSAAKAMYKGRPR